MTIMLRSPDGGSKPVDVDAVPRIGDYLVETMGRPGCFRVRLRPEDEGSYLVAEVRPSPEEGKTQVGAFRAMASTR